MKKITFVFCMLAVLFAQAQYTGPGYYRVHNAGSNGYISIKGTQYKYSTYPDAFWSCVLMQHDPSQVSEPGSIIFIPDTVQTSLFAQGVSTYSLTGMPLTILPAKVDEGGKPSYIAQTYNANFFGGRIPCIFRDYGIGFTAGTLEVTESRWWIEPVNESSMETSYFGLKPVNAEVDDEDIEYWATLCCDFPCLIPEDGGIEGAYTVNHVYYPQDNIAMIKPIKRYDQGDTIPGATPILIKCTSPDVKDNKLVPVQEPANCTEMPITADLLMGNYFSVFSNHGHLNDYSIFIDYIPDQSTPANDNYLALGMDENGKIGFFPKVEGSYMDANTAWLDISSLESKNVSAVYFIVDGDGNGDGTCDMSDLTILINYLLGAEPSRGPINLVGVDMNNNNVVDMTDLALLINHLLYN